MFELNLINDKVVVVESCYVMIGSSGLRLRRKHKQVKGDYEARSENEREFQWRVVDKLVYDGHLTC